MPETQLIGPPVGSTPAHLKPSGAARCGLPDDILKEASHRLSIMSLLGGALWVVGTVLYRLAIWLQTGRSSSAPGMKDVVASETVANVISAASVVLSFALFFYARKPNRDPRFVLDLGLIYMVLTALALGLSWHWQPVPVEASVAPTITWIGPVMLMFAAIVPSTPGKMLVAAFIAASMSPLGMVIAKLRGAWEFGSWSNVLLMHYPDYIMAGVAVVISHVVMGLGEEVTKARELGSYQLGELLGRGGMGEVYRATHRMLARPAAIKLIRPEMLGGVGDAAARLAVTRFRREAQAAANLRSPHTVELYDFGVTADQTLYFVMELLDGMDLETLVRQTGAVPAARVIYILRQVCDSLEEAHVAGLVHRDIKPANIHLGRVGLHHDVIKVLDFGLVKSVSSDESEQTLGTAAGLTPGTPAYLAPEIAMGEAYDGRADLYALGCVGYYLLTGQLVFEANNSLQMVSKHMSETPIPPSQRTELPVPPELEVAILRCLAKRPQNRPATAAELSAALAAVNARPWDEAQAKQWWNGHAPRTSRPDIGLAVSGKAG